MHYVPPRLAQSLLYTPILFHARMLHNPVNTKLKFIIIFLINGNKMQKKKNIFFTSYF